MPIEIKEELFGIITVCSDNTVWVWCNGGPRQIKCPEDLSEITPDMLYQLESMAAAINLATMIGSRQHHRHLLPKDHVTFVYDIIEKKLTSSFKGAASNTVATDHMDTWETVAHVTMSIICGVEKYKQQVSFDLETLVDLHPVLNELGDVVKVVKPGGGEVCLIHKQGQAQDKFGPDQPFQLLRPVPELHVSEYIMVMLDGNCGTGVIGGHGGIIPVPQSVATFNKRLLLNVAKVWCNPVVPVARAVQDFLTNRYIDSLKAHHFNFETAVQVLVEVNTGRIIGIATNRAKNMVGVDFEPLIQIVNEFLTDSTVDQNEDNDLALPTPEEVKKLILSSGLSAVEVIESLRAHVTNPSKHGGAYKSSDWSGDIRLHTCTMDGNLYDPEQIEIVERVVKEAGWQLAWSSDAEKGVSYFNLSDLK